MITTLLVYKNKAKEVFYRNDIYIIPMIKFLIILAAMLILGSTLGAQEMLSSPLIGVGVAALCAFLPSNMIVLIMSVILLGHFFAISMELTAITFVMLLIMLCLYFRFSPKDGILLILMPLAFVFKISYLVPIMVGVFLTPASIIPVGFGVFLYYALMFVHANLVGISSSGDNLIANATNYATGLLNNQEMFVVILVYAVMIFLIWLVRKMAIPYAFQIAIAVGVIFELIAFIVVAMVLKIGPSLLGVIIQTIISTALALLIQFLAFPLDYHRTETMQFEDDDYYYYVKAVPKYVVTKPSVSVKRINAKKAKNGRNER